MVTLETLAAFDHLLWLRTGSRAADVLNCNQSTISRHAKICEALFGVSLHKRHAEWCITGDQSLLLAERRVHQLCRWERNLPLRLDAQHWLSDHCEALGLQDWIRGNLNYLEYKQPSHLLRSRIIDAWLCSAPDHPRDPALASLQLCSMPSYLVVKRTHPLLRRSALRISDVSAYPLLPLPLDAFPVFQGMLASLGLAGAVTAGAGAVAASDPTEAAPVEDLMVGIASPMTLGLYGPDWVVLPLTLPVRVGAVLMVRAEFADHPRTRQLVAALLQRLTELACGCEDVELLQPGCFSAT